LITEIAKLKKQVKQKKNKKQKKNQLVLHKYSEALIPLRLKGNKKICQNIDK
jgi:hypothetical protein